MRKHNAPVEGMYPGVVAIVGDANMFCLDCAAAYYGLDAMRSTVDGTAECYDDDGNILMAVLAGSEDTRDTDAEHEHAHAHPRARRRVFSRYCGCGARFYHGADN